MIKVNLVVLIFLFPLLGIAQNGGNRNSLSNKEHVDGQFSLGMRNTANLFGKGNNYGLGYGGQFRIRAGKRLNTEWYADYIKTNYSGVGQRETVHIGWSVMFYPFNTSTRKGAFTPYIIAGHCFDYARVKSNLYYDPALTSFTSNSAKRWTSAVQLGLGASYHISDRLDLSLSAQYMTHLGKDIRAEVEQVDESSEQYLHIYDDLDDLTLEGHLLMTMSLNYILFDFIKSRH